MYYDQRWDMYVFIREHKFSSIGYKVGARFRLSYKYIHIPCLIMKPFLNHTTLQDAQCHNSFLTSDMYFVTDIEPD